MSQKRAAFIAQNYAEDAHLASPEVITYYKEFVGDQFSDPTLYNFDTNLAVLIDLLVSPDASEIHLIHKILLLALTRLPDQDFDLCLFQIPLELQQNDPGLSYLNRLESILRNCKFTELWASLYGKDVEALPNDCKDIKTFLHSEYFIKAVRKFIAWCISITYINIASNVLASLLNIDSEKQLEDFCRQQNWVYKSKIDDKTSLIEINNSAEIEKLSEQNTKDVFDERTLKKCLEALNKNSTHGEDAKAAYIFAES